MLDDCAAGARETDYPAGEEVPRIRDAGGAEWASQTGTTANSSSSGSERVLDGITVVGCSVEGPVAVPQNAGSLDGKSRCSLIYKHCQLIMLFRVAT